MSPEGPGGVQVRKGWKFRCDKCPFVEECAYYGATLNEDEENNPENWCFVIDYNKGWFTLSCVTYDGPRNRAAQVFKKTQEVDHD